MTENMAAKTQDFDYQDFLGSITGRQWKKIGACRRAGIAAPLFSLYSEKSSGIGEYPDIKQLADWCVQTGMSIIQLLPMNDVGFEFTPYDAKSTFALEPMYLSLESLKGVTPTRYQKDIEDLRAEFPLNTLRVNYGIKAAKLDLLKKMFRGSRSKQSKAFLAFKEQNRFWLTDYAIFKVIKELEEQRGWQDWPEPLRCKDAAALAQIEADHGEALAFESWLQWQCCEQFRDAKQYAAKQKILLMGDLPFLVSRDSADVWSHQHYFKLDRSSGAPPDLYFANGQRWGMPPYNWPEIETNGYDYLSEKLKYAENFSDFFRIDHSVGTFRLWTIDLHEPDESAGFNGVYDPQDESVWEEHGRNLLSRMIHSASMLPCAEDLGTIPDCSFKVLKEFCIPGMDVQRWLRHWDEDGSFKSGNSYRRNSIVVVSTHDMTHFEAWWAQEIGTVDEMLFARQCTDKGMDFGALKPRLFDLENSRDGRLKWRPEMGSREALLQLLGRPEHEVGDLLGAHQNSAYEKRQFLEYVGLTPEDEDNVTGVLWGALEKASASASVFSIQLLHDWLALSGVFKGDPAEYRINRPGTMGEHNWTVRAPVSLDEMMKMSQNGAIRELHARTGRI